MYVCMFVHDILRLHIILFILTLAIVDYIY